MPLQSKLRAIWRYRPRVLTVALLFVLAAVIAMANFTSEIQRLPGRGGLGVIYRRGLYGWPLMWHWHDIAPTIAPDVIVGWEYSRARRAANVACWIIVLAVPAAGCEWLLRRYRPRLRWSLRTMLAAVALVAAFCAWFAAARNRANLQDPVIADLEQHGQCVAVERPGPKWLEFVVLRTFPQLRWLRIKVRQPSSDLLAGLGQLTQLEGLYLDATHFTADSLPQLAGLTNLKMLSVEFGDEGAFSQMPPLPEVEAVEFVLSYVGGRDLRRLSALPRLKALDLKYASLGADVDLADLASLDSLEEVTVDGDDMSAAVLKSFAAIKQLRALHICERNADIFEDDVQTTLKLDGGDELLGGGDELTVLAREVDGLRRALQSLRRSHPGIVVDGNAYAIDRRYSQEPPWERIRWLYNPEPPWDNLESSTLRSTWLPSRLMMPSVSQVGTGWADQSQGEDLEVEEQTD